VISGRGWRGFFSVVAKTEKKKRAFFYPQFNAYVLLFSLAAHSSPLIGSYNIFYLPFSFFQNPAFIDLQDGISIGSDFAYDVGLKKYEFAIGVLNSYDDNTAAICVMKGLDNTYSTLCAAVGAGSGGFHGGVNCKFFFKDGFPLFTFDVGGMYQYATSKYIALAMKNIFPSDTAHPLLSPSLSIATGGKIVVDHLYFNLYVDGAIKNYRTNEFSFGGGGDLRFNLFRQPILSFYVKGWARKDAANVDCTIEAAAGPAFPINRGIFGLFLGYRSELLHTKESAVSFSLVCNPYHALGKDSRGAELKIVLSTDTLSPNADSIEDVLYIEIRTTIPPRLSIQRWSLIISKKEEFSLKPVKYHMGGGIPPSTIEWNVRNEAEELVETGQYTIQMIMIDSYKRTVSTPLIDVYIKSM
jgi:hypothetical protein